MKGGISRTALNIYSAALLLGTIIVLALIVWRPCGLLEDLTLLTTTVLLLSPKLHCGYFSLLVLMLAPLLRKYRAEALYFISSLLILVADILKFPIRDYRASFGLLIAGSLMLIATMVWLRWSYSHQRGRT